MRIMFLGEDAQPLVEEIVLASVDEKDGRFVLALVAQDDSEYSVYVGGQECAYNQLETLLYNGYLDLRAYAVEYFEDYDTPGYVFGESEDD